MLLHAIIQLFFAHIYNVIRWVKLPKDVRLNVAARRDVPDVLVIMRVHHLVILERKGAIWIDAAIRFSFGGGLVPSARGRLRCGSTACWFWALTLVGAHGRRITIILHLSIK